MAFVWGPAPLLEVVCDGAVSVNSSHIAGQLRLVWSNDTPLRHYGIRVELARLIGVSRSATHSTPSHCCCCRCCIRVCMDG